MDIFELIICIIVTLFALFIGFIATYLTINTLIKFFRERKSNKARTLTKKEIENISLFLLGFAASAFWVSTLGSILIGKLGGR